MTGQRVGNANAFGRSSLLDLVPAKAFGSGAHETTASCLRLLAERHLSHGSAVLDWGAGTGILSLHALLGGAGRALALDIDPDAILACRRNAAHNGLSDRFRAVLGSIESVRADIRFDLVFANLPGDLIMGQGTRLAGCLAAGGTLIVSGLRFDEDFGVRRTFEGLGLIAQRRIFLTEYVTQAWKKPDTK